jgi:hypothetical protein
MARKITRLEISMHYGSGFVIRHGQAVAVEHTNHRHIALVITPVDPVPIQDPEADIFDLQSDGLARFKKSSMGSVCPTITWPASGE